MLPLLFGLIFILFVNGDRTYKNSEYNFKFKYPKSAHLEFISSNNGTSEISLADTFGIIFLNSRSSMRIQVIRKPNNMLANATVINSINFGNNTYNNVNTGSPCNYLVSNEKIYLCILTNPDLNIDQLQKNKEFLRIFKSIEFN